SGVEGIATRHGYRIEMLEESLFHLDTDPGERRNLAQQQPEIVQRLRTAADAVRKELGDSLRGIAGRGLRAPGLDSE
ncbi:MAG: arylsulfatase, partial [Planctomycetaceae bacterium]